MSALVGQCLEAKPHSASPAYRQLSMSPSQTNRSYDWQLLLYWWIDSGQVHKPRNDRDEQVCVSKYDMFPNKSYHAVLHASH